MKYLFTVLLLFLFFSIEAQRWPLNPQGNQYSLVGTIGEDRGTGPLARSRFHKGCDIAESAGTLVVSIEDGIVSNVGSSSLCVGTYCYIHVVPIPSLVLGDTIASGDTIGVIQAITNEHIHLQKTDSLFNRIPNGNTDAIVWANPLNYLLPFADNFSPNIQGLSVFEYQSYGNNVGRDFYGDIDVVINVTDPRVTANGGNGNANNTQGVAPYSMSYMLLDSTQTDTFFQHENTFEFAPDNVNTDSIFTQSSSYLTSDYEYYLNSHFRTQPIRRPFNIRKSIGVGLAGTPDSSLVKDGDRILLKVTACDIVGNCDDEIYQQGGSDYLLTIDNFKPYVKSLTASINDKVIYDFHWETVNGQLEPRGGIVQNLPDSGRFDALGLGLGMIVEVETSEQMESLSLDLSRLVPNCSDGPLISSSDAQPTTDRKNWTFWFSDLSACPFGDGQIDPTGGPWKFIFEGKDFGPDGLPGSNLLGFHEMYDAVADGNGNSALRVPLVHRVSTTAPEWSTSGHPDLVEGVDSTHYFGFSCASDGLWSPPQSNQRSKVRTEDAISYVCCGSFEAPTVSIANHSLEGDCSGRIQLFAGEDAPETSYTISDDIGVVDSGVTGNEPVESVDLCPREYFVELVNEFGCVFRDTVEVFTCLSLGNSPGQLNTNVIRHDIDRPGQLGASCAGVLEVEALGGNGPFLVQIFLQASNGDDRPTLVEQLELTDAQGVIIRGICNGDYTIVFTNRFGCEFIRTETVNVCGRDNCCEDFRLYTLGEILGEVPQVCSGDCDGVLSVSTSMGGLDPFGRTVSYQWSTGESGSTIRNLCSGTYSVTATDEFGCSATRSFEVCCVDLEFRDRVDAGPDGLSGEVTIIPTSDVEVISLTMNGQSLNVISGQPIRLENLEEGIYEFILENEVGCRKYSRIVINGCPEVTEEVEVVCDNLSWAGGIALRIDLRDGESSIVWENPEDNGFLSLENSDVMVYTNNSEENMVKASVFSESGCLVRIVTFDVRLGELLSEDDGATYRSSISKTLYVESGQEEIPYSGILSNRPGINLILEDASPDLLEVEYNGSTITITNLEIGSNVIRFVPDGTRYDECNRFAVNQSYSVSVFECKPLTDEVVRIVSSGIFNGNTSAPLITVDVTNLGEYSAPLTYHLLDFDQNELSSGASNTLRPPFSGFFFVRITDPCGNDWISSSIRIGNCEPGEVIYEKSNDGCDSFGNLTRSWFKYHGFIAPASIDRQIGDRVFIEITKNGWERLAFRFATITEIIPQGNGLNHYKTDQFEENNGKFYVNGTNTFEIEVSTCRSNNPNDQCRSDCSYTSGRFGFNKINLRFPFVDVTNDEEDVDILGGLIIYGSEFTGPYWLGFGRCDACQILDEVIDQNIIDQSVCKNPRRFENFAPFIFDPDTPGSCGNGGDLLIPSSFMGAGNGEDFVRIRVDPTNNFITMSEGGRCGCIFPAVTVDYSLGPENPVPVYAEFTCNDDEDPGTYVFEIDEETVDQLCVEYGCEGECTYQINGCGADLLCDGDVIQEDIHEIEFPMETERCHVIIGETELNNGTIEYDVLVGYPCIADPCNGALFTVTGSTFLHETNTGLESWQIEILSRSSPPCQSVLHCETYEWEPLLENAPNSTDAELVNEDTSELFEIRNKPLEINIYPNPFNSALSSELVVESSFDVVQVSIYSLSGQKLYGIKSPLPQRVNSISLDGIPLGYQRVILVKVLLDSGETVTRKVIITK